MFHCAVPPNIGAQVPPPSASDLRKVIIVGRHLGCLGALNLLMEAKPGTPEAGTWRRLVEEVRTLPQTPSGEDADTVRPLFRELGMFKGARA